MRGEGEGGREAWRFREVGRGVDSGRVCGVQWYRVWTARSSVIHQNSKSHQAYYILQVDQASFKF
jgi:hypothetical protein